MVVLLSHISLFHFARAVVITLDAMGYSQAWNKLPDMVKTLRSKLLLKKTLKNSKLESINQK